MNLVRLPGSVRGLYAVTLEFMTTKKEPSGRYYTRFRIDGEPFARRHDRKQDGIDWENTTRADHLRGTYIDPKKGKTTFREYAELWLSHQVHFRPRTMEAYEIYLRLHIYPYFGKRRMSSITRSDVKEWVATLVRKGMKPAYIETLFAPVTAIFISAVDDGALLSTPCRKIKLPEVTPHEVIIPKVPDVELLESVFHPQWRNAVWVGAGAGTRIGECMGLTESRIDFDRELITIDRQLQRHHGHLVICPPKTKAGTRTLPVGTRTLEALRHQLDNFPTTECPDEDGKMIGGLLFSNLRGRPTNPQSWDPQWTMAVERAGLNPELRFHDLRHFFASMLLRAKISEMVVAKWMGHSSTDELKIYGHEWDDDQDRTREAIELMLPPVRPNLTLVQVEEAS